MGEYYEIVGGSDNSKEDRSAPLALPAPPATGVLPPTPIALPPPTPVAQLDQALSATERTRESEVELDDGVKKEGAGEKGDKDRKIMCASGSRSRSRSRSQSGR